jgi:hypothetical protein
VAEKTKVASLAAVALAAFVAAGLMRDINAAIDANGELGDSSSEQVRGAVL